MDSVCGLLCTLCVSLTTFTYLLSVCLCAHVFNGKLCANQKITWHVGVGSVLPIMWAPWTKFRLLGSYKESSPYLSLFHFKMHWFMLWVTWSLLSHPLFMTNHSGKTIYIFLWATVYVVVLSSLWVPLRTFQQFIPCPEQVSGTTLLYRTQSLSSFVSHQLILLLIPSLHLLMLRRLTKFQNAWWCYLPGNMVFTLHQVLVHLIWPLKQQSIE